MPFKCLALTFSLVIFSYSAAYTIIDIETTKADIITILQQKNPLLITEFNTLYRRYQQLITTFFDTNNNDSLIFHIKHMEDELQFLHSLCSDLRFKCVQPILRTYAEHIGSLIVILKQYVRSVNVITLALKLQHFKFLLPGNIKERGNLSLLHSLHHRLSCI
jgi:hypothetical protein